MVNAGRSSKRPASPGSQLSCGNSDGEPSTPALGPSRVAPPTWQNLASEMPGGQAGAELSHQPLPGAPQGHQASWGWWTPSWPQQPPCTVEGSGKRQGLESWWGQGPAPAGGWAEPRPQDRPARGRVPGCWRRGASQRRFQSRARAAPLHFPQPFPEAPL